MIKSINFKGDYMRPKSSAFYYEPLECEQCKSKADLMMHPYEEDVLCSDCVREALLKEDLEMEEEDEYEALTLEERNK